VLTVGVMTLFEGRRLLRNFPTVFFSLAFPLMLLAIFGSIYGNDPRAQFDGRGTIDVSVPAYACLVIAVTGLMSFPLNLAEYRERKVLKRMRATPVGPFRLLAAQLNVNVALTLAGLVALVGFAAALFALRAPVHPWLVAPAAALAIVAIFGIGLMIAAVARTERGAVLFANLLYFPMIFLSGATLPSELFPQTLRDVTQVLPLTHAVTVLKAAWLGGEGFPAASVVYLGVCALVCIGVAIRTFRWA
jgi:ABC-2 type transport system permease protein